MEAAPILTEDERNIAIARCPEVQRPLFTGWLDGTHELDGTPIEVAAG